jgi:sulfoacetaldehyde dehydrogenase
MTAVLPEDEVIAATILRARSVAEKVEYWTQRRVDTMIAAVGWHCYREDNVRAMSQLAKPVRVVAATCPTTAPCSTAVCIALPVLKTGNALTLIPSPRGSDAGQHCTTVRRHDSLQTCRGEPIKPIPAGQKGNAL